MALIELRHMTKTFREADRISGGEASAIGARVEGGLMQELVNGPGKGTFTLHDIDLVFPDGKTTVILGPSGCGKSSLLRLLAGLETPDSGQLFIDGADRTNSTPAERRLGMVFQNYALYPNLEVKANVLSWFAFRKKTPELEAEAKVRLERTSQLLGVSLESLLGKMPKGLSGGERQRVALGRCLTRDPALFLMDEPFSSLDAPLRERYRVELRRLLSQFKITTVVVTHDQQEASILADRLVILDRGQVVQVGTPQELTDQPVNRFVAEFWNPDPLLPALLDLGEFAVRPQDLRLGVLEGCPQFEAEVVAVEALAYGGRRIARVRVGSQIVPVPLRSAMSSPERGKTVLSLARWHQFDE